MSLRAHYRVADTFLILSSGVARDRWLPRTECKRVRCGTTPAAASISFSKFILPGRTGEIDGLPGGGDGGIESTGGGIGDGQRVEIREHAVAGPAQALSARVTARTGSPPSDGARVANNHARLFWTSA